MNELAQNEMKHDKPARRNKRLTALSVIWSLIVFGVYLLIDYWNVTRDGWTASNVTITFFLFAQLAIALIFPVLGATGKQDKKNKKKLKKWLKLSKKVTLKLITLITSILLLTSMQNTAVDYKAILNMVFTIASIVMLGMQISIRIISYFIKRKAKSFMNKRHAANEPILTDGTDIQEDIDLLSRLE